MVKREQIQISASEKEEGGTTRDYKSKKEKKPKAKFAEETISLGGSSDEDDDSWSVAKERRKDLEAKKQANDSTRRDKRKTQFPSQLDCFELTSMRKSVMVPKESGGLFSRLRGENDKKKVLLIRKHNEEQVRGDDKWRKKRRTEALAMLGLDEKGAQALIAAQADVMEKEQEDWRSKSKAEALALLGVDEDDCEIVYCDDDDLDDDMRAKMEEYTLEGAKSSMTLMECSSDEEESTMRRLKGLGLGKLRKVATSSPVSETKKGMRKRKKEFGKLSKGSSSKVKFFKSKFRKRSSDDESSDDEPPPEVFKPYYHEDLFAKEKEIERQMKEHPELFADKEESSEED